MLQFWFEMGGDGTKRYRKMKRRRRTHIGSMGSVTRRGGVTTSDRGEAALRRKRGENASWINGNLSGSKNKENSHSRFI
jgi:hypothetical protein